MFGIGKSLKKAAKRFGAKLKDNPLKTLIDPFGVSDSAKNVLDSAEGIVKGLFTPDIPDPAAVAPIPDDELTRKSKQRAAQRKYAKGGRAGTMLTSDSSTLG